MSALSLTYVHQQFEAALPIITGGAEYAFRGRRPHDRDDAVGTADGSAIAIAVGIG